MIDWKVRLHNKSFWVALVPALLLLAQTAAGVFGLQLELGQFGDSLLALINALFSVLVLVGVVNDPTTQGFGDGRKEGHDGK